MLQQSTRIGIALALLSFTGLGMAQDIEPRRWTPCGQKTHLYWDINTLTYSVPIMVLLCIAP
jgi:hypothetical protein